MAKEFIKIGDVYVPTDKVDYYYPISKDRVLMLSVAGTEIPFNIAPTNKAFKKLLHNLNKTLCSTITDVNPTNNKDDD